MVAARNAGTSAPHIDFDAARSLMVDDQVRPIEVDDPRILSAMRTLPRERCAPDAERQFAYADRTLPLTDGRYLLQPMIAARLTQAAGIVNEERILVVAAGTGYLAALASHLGGRVIAVESDSDLRAVGEAFTGDVAPGVVWRHGPLESGAAADAPFDLILIDGGVQEIPDFCAAQLAPGGRVVGLLSRDGVASSAFVAELDRSTAKGNAAKGGQPIVSQGESAWAIRLQFDAPAPLLQELLPKPVFSF
ncbi:hypothetical protein HK28_08695 [Acetobacter sp. DsW_063]|nr:hypothetical protein HK28_08695 [Acetobacter sp. DsW_063]